MQHCNMFQTCIFKENFNKVLMQCSHSKHANIIQMWGYNYNKTKLVCIRCKYHIYQNFKKVQKMENMNSVPLFMPKKPK
jgi:Zn ribbon nucleic-acid-binding protein